MKAYDKRIYYRPQLEPFYDQEWEEAEKSGDNPQYYFQTGGFGIIVRKYKPSVARLVMERTGMILRSAEDFCSMAERRE